MDVHKKATRSYNMSQIKGKNTKPEMLGIGTCFLILMQVFYWTQNPNKWSLNNIKETQKYDE
jgi:G:T-mismatch repair DNA endonuclease (very short patch repair protein)